MKAFWILVLLGTPDHSWAVGGFRAWAERHGVAHLAATDPVHAGGPSALLCYAVGQVPQQATASVARITPEAITFPKAADAAAGGDVAWSLEWSPDLEDWKAVAPDDQDAGSLTFSIAEQEAAGGFVRLRIVRPLHPAAAEYAVRTGLSGEPLKEVSHLLHELGDAGVEPELLVLLGDRYGARAGDRVEAVIGSAGTVTGTISSSDRSMVFDGSPAWIEFENPARSAAADSYTLLAVASADAVEGTVVLGSAFGGAGSRGPRLMFNGSSSWGGMPGRVAADANNGTPSGTTGWNTVYRVHSGVRITPAALHFDSALRVPRGDLPLPPAAPGLVVSGGIGRQPGAAAPLGASLWNDGPTFRIGANPGGGGFHRGGISLVLVTRSRMASELVYQLAATAPVRAGVLPSYGTGVIAVFDGDSVTEGAGSPGAGYGRWSWPAQLFGGEAEQAAGGQWMGSFNGRNLAVGGRAIAANEANWQHTARHILRRAEWGRRYYFTMISHNQSPLKGLPPMADPTSLARLRTLWRNAAAVGAIPVCVGLIPGQTETAEYRQEYEEGYAAVRTLAEAEGVPFVDTAAISQLRPGEFPSGSENFYLDVIHPTERGYRLIAQEVAATVPFPGSAAARSLARPAISGAAVVGAELIADPGVWEHEPAALGFQWMRDGYDIPQATAATHTVSLADAGAKLSCRVTATNAAGSAERTSSHTPLISSP